MLEYEWGNPSMMMLFSDENVHESELNRQVFDPYTGQTLTNNHNDHGHDQGLFHQNIYTQVASTKTHFIKSLYDPRAYAAASASYAVSGAHVSQAFEPAGPAGFVTVPKSEPVVVPGGVDFDLGGSNSRLIMSRVGLNLGGRTYFSSTDQDDVFVNRFYGRSRAVDPGSVNSPRCQAEGCNADLTHSKHYHRRHKVCEFHSKAATVIAAGLTQRFCQQCSRFHVLSEFDSGKRSCRKRLADHNRRRRKSQQGNQELVNNKSSLTENHARISI